MKISLPIFPLQTHWKKLKRNNSYTLFVFFRPQYYKISQLDNNLCTTIREMNLNLVRHVYIYDIQARINSIKYFSNVAEFIILSNDEISDDLISSDQLTEFNPLH